MTDSTVRTRFAPSPTGALHLGNARTALFNWLFARGHDGRFVLRSEDTDRERSTEGALAAVEADLRWLGIDHDEGPAIGGHAGPYRQSQRHEIHRGLLDDLLTRDLAYPCFCSREELAESRRQQVAAGRAPRYSGKCARLSAAEREARMAAGREYSVRFRVPSSGSITFDDLVYGRQSFQLRDIGDFVIARADGTPGFLFANAVDDAYMGITHVLRGGDHLTNTSRQILLLRALGLRQPAYGHFGLITDAGGSPLSKREGGATLADLRRIGYLPEAIRNHLARVGVSGYPGELLDPESLAGNFDLARVSRGPAVHDNRALDGWQRKAVDVLDEGELMAWLAETVPDVAESLPAASAEPFLRAIRPNLLFPGDARFWADVVFGDGVTPDDEAQSAIAAAGADMFEQALRTTAPAPTDDFRTWAKAVGKAAGCTGRRLFQPLRAALTGRLSGPELAEIVPLMGDESVRRRLRRALGLVGQAERHHIN